MSQVKRTSAKETLAKILGIISLSDFENLAIDVLENRKSGKVYFDLSVLRTSLGLEDGTAKTLSEKFHIDKTDVRNALMALVYLFRGILTGGPETLERELERIEKIGDKSKGLVEIGEKLLQRFPDIRERFYVSTFCKTNYLGDIDWEIVLKVVEHPIYGFEKRERFSVCVLRFLLERPISAVRPFVGREPGAIPVFEASLSDIEKIIATFSEIRDKMKETTKEFVMEREK
jgi:hypothetical protein